MKLSAGDSGRSISIDCLRGVAALAVLVHHVIKDDHAIGNLGTAGVYLFFLISGYCIVLSLSNLGSRPIRNFLIRRFFRLYPIYWIAVFFAAFLSEDRIDAGQIAANLTMVQTALRVPDINGVFWTLFIELVFYAVVVVFIYLKIERKPAVFLTGAITLSLGALLAAVTGRLTGIPIPYGHLLFFSLFMIGGWTAFVNGRAGKIDVKAIVALAGSYLVVVYLVAELVYGVGGRSVEMPPTAFFGNYFFAVTVFFLVLHYELLEWKRFRYLGEISFGIYLFHRPIRDVLETRVDDLSLRFALVLVASVLISYILNKLIENPCIQLGRRLSR